MSDTGKTTEDDNLVVHEMHLVGVADLRKRWAWFVGVGIALIIFGMIAISSAVLVTIVTMEVIGWLMIFGGILQTAHGFTHKAWGGFFLDLFAGILSAVTGLLIVGHPGATAGALTLMIAMLLIFGGVFRLGVALSIRFPISSWLLLHGIMNILLGAIILQSWPISGAWVIGTFIGVDMLLNGWTLVMLGLAARPKTA